MANEQNLKPFTSDQSREEAKKNGAKGGKRSGEVRSMNAEMRKRLEQIVKMTLKDGKADKINYLITQYTCFQNQSEHKTLWA